MSRMKNEYQPSELSEQSSAVLPKDTMTVAEASEYLGLKKSYLYKLTSTRQIPFYKYGGRIVLFDRAALEKWRADRMLPVPTKAETAARAAAYCASHPTKQ